MNTIKFVLKAIGLIVHYLSQFIPRKSKKWIFGSRSMFGDNAKFLFYKIHDSHPEIKAIWITHKWKEKKKLRESGFKAHYFLSPIGLFHCLTAKVYISTTSISDINPYTSGNAFYVNLWHGVGVKKLRWLAPQLFMKRYKLHDIKQMHTSLRFKIETFANLFRKPDMYLVPSLFQAETFFSPMFETPLEKCLLANYPRNEILLWDEEKIKDFIKRHEPETTIALVSKIKSYNRTYIYMPTWRNDQSDFVTAAGINWEELNNILINKNALLILKLHPYTHIDLEFIKKLSNILIFPSQSDVYTILPFTDCLITDYSSIYSDYSLMNKEIILFCFDYQEYVKKSYSLSEYNKYYPGIRAYNFQELLSLIKNETDCHVSKDEHDFIMKTYWDSAFNNIDIIEEIKKRININNINS